MRSNYSMFTPVIPNESTRLKPSTNIANYSLLETSSNKSSAKKNDSLVEMVDSTELKLVSDDKKPGELKDFLDGRITDLNREEKIARELVRKEAAQAAEVLKAKEADEPHIVCEYSRAAQHCCEPISRCNGAVCGCGVCVCLPCTFLLVVCLSGGEDNVPEDFHCQLSNCANECGIYSSRAMIRLLGAIGGILCYCCEKVNRNADSVSLAKNEDTLFCCPVVTRKEANLVGLNDKPKSLWLGPMSQQM